jgi:thiol-disulfide isomerase/thioredoxin
VSGKRVESFALRDLDGKPWVYRPGQSRLVLLGFWYSTCGPCRAAISHMVNLHQTYAARGLEVVGIMYEKGQVADQVAHARAACNRFGVHFTTLLGEGESCRVKTHLQVAVFPTLLLLDDTGRIVWNSGLDGIAEEPTRHDLDVEIRRHLNVK